MAWFLLILAGLFEIGWAIGLRYTEGFTRPWPSVLTALCVILSMYLLAAAARSLPLGTAYAIWTGIGIVGTVLLSIYLFGEPGDPLRLFFIGMIIFGIVGLKLVTPI